MLKRKVNEIFQAIIEHQLGIPHMQLKQIEIKDTMLCIIKLDIEIKP